jgi:tRNA1(Val) A37 N6-methylase TrmN6
MVRRGRRPSGRTSTPAVKLRVLEPSAGTGNLAKIAALNCDVDCVEFQTKLAGALARSRLYRKVYNTDFLRLVPKTTGLYDRVLMNPPFDRERDIDHVMHALQFVKPDGCLVAIMSAGTEFRDTKKSIAFRELMKKMNATWRDLPAGSFSEVGTNCNA